MTPLDGGKPSLPVRVAHPDNELSGPPEFSPLPNSVNLGNPVIWLKLSDSISVGKEGEPDQAGGAEAEEERVGLQAAGLEETQDFPHAHA